MMDKRKASDTFAALRKQAGALLGPELGGVESLSLEEARWLVQELHTYQIELELQNEDLRQTQVELLDSRKKYTDLYDFAPLGYLTVSDKGLVVGANLTIAEMLACERAHLLGRPFSAFIVPEDQDFYYRCRLTLIQSGTTRDCELRMMKKDGVTFHAQLRGSINPVVDGGSGQIRVVITDITARKNAEQENARLEFQLRQSQKMEAIGTLAGGMAHEFNNILGIILGSAELALDDVTESDPVYERLQININAARRAADIVKQILLFSRQGQYSIQTFAPGHVLRETLHLIQSTAPSSIQFVQDLREGRGSIRADKTQIGQVLLNLYRNAVDAMHGTGTLSIGLQEVGCTAGELARSDMEPGPYLKLSVSDTGDGMDTATLERIFDPFFTTKEVGKGTGMGLAVVKGIVENSNGMIEVESMPGQGTTVHVYFPIIIEEGIDHEIAEDAPLPRGNEKILLVDDEEDLAVMVALVLEHLGYTVTGRTSSTEALETFRTQPDSFDLVITDQTMSGLTGDKLATELLKIRPDIPIIMCTGYSSFMPDEKARKLGIRDYCLKPLDRKVLARKVRRVLDRRV